MIIEHLSCSFESGSEHSKAHQLIYDHDGEIKHDKSQETVTQEAEKPVTTIHEISKLVI